MLARTDPEHLLDAALEALANGPDRAALDALRVPVYTTDPDGAVTYWNRACADFAGREPQLGKDRWCVTWRLFTTAGAPLAHGECPMAQTIRHRVPIRDVVAIAERPDGSRVAFRPYPTPLFDADDNFTGAINLLVDVTDEQSEALRAQADHCRRLAEAMYDRNACRVLVDMAAGLDKTADELAGERRRS